MDGSLLDLYLAMGVMALLSAAAFVAGLRIFRRLSRSSALVALLASIAALVLYLQHGQDRLVYARWLPVSSVMIYANLTPLLAAVSAAIAWHAVRPADAAAADAPDSADAPPPRAIVRRLLLILPLWSMAAVQAWNVVWAKPPPLGMHRPSLVVRQTTPASCSPAAAVTLLQRYGIRTTEAEMADVCRTTRQGTRTLGVYRGLRLKAGDTHDVAIYTGPAEGLRQFADSPVLINVGLDPEDAALNPRFASDWGWQPGTRHTVVVFGFGRDGRALVGDPAIGFERWSPEALATLWRFEAFKLVPRTRETP